MSEIRFRKEKFKELILYLAEKCETDPSFGISKLGRLLYSCDFTAYVELGQPITGAVYQRSDRGPSPQVLSAIREEMHAEGLLFVREASKYGRQEKRPLALRSADLASFTGEEVALIDRIIGKLWELDSAQVNVPSLGDVGWRLAEEGETIPYETAFVVSIDAA